MASGRLPGNRATRSIAAAASMNTIDSDVLVLEDRAQVPVENAPTEAVAMNADTTRLVTGVDNCSLSFKRMFAKLSMTA